MPFNNLFVSGLAVGAIGDIGLQVANKAGRGNAGLVNYFNDANPAWRVAQASLLTGVWSGLYQALDGAQSPLGFLCWTGLVDLTYRFHHDILFPDLKEYYEKNRIDMTILYNVISGALVLGFDKLFL